MFSWKGILFAFVLLSCNVWAQEAFIVRFNLNEGIKSYLRANQLDVAGVNYNTNEIEAILTEEEFEQLSAQKSAMIKFSFPQNLAMAPDEEYKNPDEVTEFINEIHERYPDITSLKVVGKTLEGRDIFAIKISDNPESDEQEPAVLVNGMHHAREVMTPEITTDMIEYLVTNYNVKDEVTKWVNNTEIWVLPMLNLDGNNKMWTSNSMWRKNTRGGYGVDINRNYPTGWNSCNGSSSYQGAQDYRGTSPASEPETQAMMNLVGSIKPVFNISYHSYSEIVIYPFGCKPRKTPTTEAVELIGGEVAQKLNYIPGTAWELLYNADGGDIDWMYTEHQVIPFVIEVNSTSEGFHPKYSTWRNKTVERNRPGWMHLLSRLNGPALSGAVNLLEYETVKIYSPGTTKLLQTYKINPDGSFFIILKTGTYDFSFEGSKQKKLSNVEIASKVNVNF